MLKVELKILLEIWSCEYLLALFTVFASITVGISTVSQKTIVISDSRKMSCLCSGVVEV